MVRPKVIFFDAGGTLFEVRGSVGETYSRFAGKHGVQADPQTLQRQFVRAFRRQPPLAFPPGLTAAELHRREAEWWRGLVRAVFAVEEFPRFDQFFAEVYEYFGRAEAWRVYADVLPALERLRIAGVRLGVISNFDSRLDALLAELGLAQFFDSAHISARVGAAKPDARIFQAALREHALAAGEAWHVGDSWREDVEGASQAGMQSWLIARDQKIVTEGEHEFGRLAQLTELLAWAL